MTPFWLGIVKLNYQVSSPWQLSCQVLPTAPKFSKACHGSQVVEVRGFDGCEDTTLLDGGATQFGLVTSGHQRHRGE